MDAQPDNVSLPRPRRFVPRGEFAEGSEGVPAMDIDAFRTDQDAAFDHTAGLPLRWSALQGGEALLDASIASCVSALTGLSRERIERLGGVGDWED